MIIRLSLLTPLFAALLNAESLPIWPHDPAPSREETRIGPGDAVRRISNVTRPTLDPVLPPPAQANGAALIVLPGGGFRHLAIDKEGYDVARWLNTLGVAGFVVRYRVSDAAAAREEAKRNGVADTREAIRIVRAHAAQWKLDPKRIGVIGFSAGGYHAAAASLKFTPENRPDFAACIYPAAPEDLKYSADAPPMFLAHADDDRLAPKDNSVRIYQALKEAKVPAELHIFSRGGHGFGMVKSGTPTDRWTDRFQEWMQDSGLLRR